MLTKLTRFEEQKILIIFVFRTHQEVKRLINRNADILNDSYVNLIMRIRISQLIWSAIIHSFIIVIRGDWL